MTALALGLALLVGLTLGLLGGGGSILTVPFLVYALGMETKEAIATSLLVVAITSAAAMVSHARAGRVRWRTGALFGAAGMAGAYAGGRLAAFIPGAWLLVAFGLMMLATAFAMLRPSKGRALASEEKPELSVVRVVLDGLVVGLVTGLVGAGGGFLVVPALALLGGLPMSAAIGTSLLVIAMKSSAGFAGYLHSVDVNFPLALGFSAVAVVGSLLGSRWAGKLSQATLRKAFGVFVVVMGVFVLGKQIPEPVVSAVLLSTTTWMVVGLLLLAVALLGTWRVIALGVHDDMHPDPLEPEPKQP